MQNRCTLVRSIHEGTFFWKIVRKEKVLTICRSSLLWARWVERICALHDTYCLLLGSSSKLSAFSHKNSGRGNALRASRYLVYSGSTMKTLAKTMTSATLLTVIRPCGSDHWPGPEPMTMTVVRTMIMTLNKDSDQNYYRGQNDDSDQCHDSEQSLTMISTIKVTRTMTVPRTKT